MHTPRVAAAQPCAGCCASRLGWPIGKGQAAAAAAAAGMAAGVVLQPLPRRAATRHLRSMVGAVGQQVLLRGAQAPPRARMLLLLCLRAWLLTRRCPGLASWGPASGEPHDGPAVCSAACICVYVRYAVASRAGAAVCFFAGASHACGSSQGFTPGPIWASTTPCLQPLSSGRGVPFLPARSKACDAARGRWRCRSAPSRGGQHMLPTTIITALAGPHPSSLLGHFFIAPSWTSVLMCGMRLSTLWKYVRVALSQCDVAPSEFHV
jgi:hypothetical protein